MKTLTFVLLLLSQTCLADLQVFPTRIQLNDRTRIGRMTMRFLGKTPTRYKISAHYYKMTRDGRVLKAEKVPEGAMDLSDKIKWSPRNPTLKPGQDQTLRVLYVGPRDLPPGDYRTHLEIVPVEEKEKSQDKGKKVNLQLKPRLALAIPVFFRRGKVDPSLSLTAFQVKPIQGKLVAHLVAKLKGPGIPRHDLEIFVADSKKSVGLVRGLTSYAPEREVRVPLDVSAGSKGQLVAQLREAALPGQKGNVLQEMKVVLK